MSINKRVMYIVDRLASNRAEFSKRTGISAVVLSHISSGRNKVSLATVEAILKAYPQLSPDYLILNTGHYLRRSESDLEEKLRITLQEVKSLEDHHHRTVIAALERALAHLVS